MKNFFFVLIVFVIFPNLSKGQIVQFYNFESSGAYLGVDEPDKEKDEKPSIFLQVEILTLQMLGFFKALLMY